MNKKSLFSFLFVLPMFFLPKLSVADELNYLSGVDSQVKSVFDYCSGKSLDDDKVNLVRSGFVNIKNGVFNGELPADYKKFVSGFYKESMIEDFYLKKDKDGFLLIIIDGGNTCNSIPLYSRNSSSSFLSEESKKGKVSEHDSIGLNGESIKSFVYKTKDGIFVLSEIKNKDTDKDYSMITAARVY